MLPRNTGRLVDDESETEIYVHCTYKGTEHAWSPSVKITI